ncbi:Pxp2p NDAI_0D00390 [Naumovozyma dairenensis CBS 421]|uniref:Carboxymuconolactone decarboxylase-like domain-containing protein n=1 Tax=Naumovozyma dairenensis (strain ATCC 10597 / BCRC 20456 / CBS 421 / NBRC 0211 / NRRL Y-12639) TaxID=1071378 RepID=G0W992_NAUDC|nr:hypothetical protein NDAI_0D00390 [Naumovozyma dairenensis CBS 421]CCD24353.1 hypothetical protein NDAI_0D00390 [Naumovozyma dairenensis CBS 421]
MNSFATHSILNPQRLIQLYQFHPKLKNIWYLVAATSFSVCNEPQEIPKLYHYAMSLSDDHAKKYRVTLAHKTMELVNNPDHDLKARLINEIYSNPSTPQLKLTQKFRDALLTSGPLAGLPRAINGLSSLKEYTPTVLLPKTPQIDPWEAAMGREEPCPATMREQIHSMQDRTKIIQRGLNHWNSLYNKVSTRVVNNMNSSYPDLWYYALVHVYGPLLSFVDVLNAQEKSLIVIASLVPQDVNPQLRGHLKGALNIGCDFETIEATRRLSILVSQWCGITWRDGIVQLTKKKK